jgi:hypothetical protein
MAKTRDKRGREEKKKKKPKKQLQADLGASVHLRHHELTATQPPARESEQA